MKRLLTALLIVIEPMVAYGDYREFRAVPVDSVIVEALTRTANATLKVTQAKCDTMLSKLSSRTVEN